MPTHEAADRRSHFSRSVSILLTAGLLAMGQAGCTLDQKAPDGWAAIVIDLEPADARPGADLNQTLERHWIGFGLVAAVSGPAAAPAPASGESPPPTPETIQVRLRPGIAGSLDHSGAGVGAGGDPRGDRLEMIAVDGADIGRPRGGGGGAAGSTGPVVIAMDPPAASLTLIGSRIDWPYSGDPGPVVGGVARISFHRGFIDAALDADADATADTLLRAALVGVNAADLRRYARLELRPTLPQIITLVEARVSPATIRSYFTAGYGFTTEQFLGLKAAGVSARDAVAFSEGGLRFTAPQLIRLEQTGVDPAYAMGLKEAGFARGVEMLVRLRSEGIDPAYARAMRRLDAVSTADELVLLHRGGITPESVETFQTAGYHLAPPQWITLDEAGVSADNALRLRRAGYDFSVQDLLTLAKWRVPTSFTLSLVSPAFEHLSADQVVTLRLRRVTPEMVRLLRRPRVEPAPRPLTEQASAPPADAAIFTAPPGRLPPLEPIDPASP